MTLLGVIAGIWLAPLLAGIVLVVREWRRPLDEMDAYCSRVDVELDDVRWEWPS